MIDYSQLGKQMEQVWGEKMSVRINAIQYFIVIVRITQLDIATR